LRVSTNSLAFSRRSVRIGREAHSPILQKGRRWTVRKNRHHSRTQLVLELNPQIPTTPVGGNTKGLVEALADLLLEALAAESKLGGVDEPEDHA
jgi:hypothetical protein